MKLITTRPPCPHHYLRFNSESLGLDQASLSSQNCPSGFGPQWDSRTTAVEVLITYMLMMYIYKIQDQPSKLQPTWHNISLFVSFPICWRIWRFTQYKGDYQILGASQVALVVKNLSANVGDIREVGSIPRSGRSPGGGHGNPLQYSCLENTYGQEEPDGLLSKVSQRDTTEAT